MPLYAISESSHWMIKMTQRRRELEGRLASAQATLEQAKGAVAHLTGALDDHNYHMQTWGEDRDGMGVAPHIVARDNLALWHRVGSGMYLVQWICAAVVFGRLAGTDRVGRD